jgi:general secretion pathway protein B
MSYILDALKKADRERTLGDVPDLETAHWGERHGRRSFRWVWIVMLLLLVNGALLAYLLGRDDTAAESPARVATAPAAEPPVFKAPRADSTALQPSERIKQPREPVYVPPPPVKRQLPAVQYMPAPVPDMAPVYTEPPAYTSAPAYTQSPPPAVTSSGVPYWDDLSLEFRSGLVLPHIDVHVYDDDPARRFILVDLQKYREGEMLDNGAVIESINESTIQLNYHGTSFLMEQ